jgi:hypothetical protein
MVMNLYHRTAQQNCPTTFYLMNVSIFPQSLSKNSPCSIILAILADTIAFVDDDDFNTIYELDENVNQPQLIRNMVPRPTPLSDIYANSHSVWFVRIVLMLIAILHTRYHLPFRGCALALLCISLIFTGLQLLPPDNPMPRTLQTVFKNFQLHDRFLIHPVCESCTCIYSPDSPTDARCRECNTELYKLAPTTLFALLRGKDPPPPTPKRVMPIQTLSSALPDFLNHGNNERSCQAWRTWQSIPGKRTEIWDGDVWKTSRGPDRKLWFDPTDDPAELRLGVTISIDWSSSPLISLLINHLYTPLGLEGSPAFSDHHKHLAYSHIQSQILHAPCGMLVLVYAAYRLILFSYRPSNLIIHAMTPGPKEPTAEELQHPLKMVVDELLELYEHGVLISTPQFPNGNCSAPQ